MTRAILHGAYGFVTGCLAYEYIGPMTFFLLAVLALVSMIVWAVVVVARKEEADPDKPPSEKRRRSRLRRLK